MAYQKVRALPGDQVIVMTNALLVESARECEAWKAVKQLASDRSDALVSVTLECALEENVRRIRSEERRHRKMIDAEPLIEWRSQYTLLTDDGTGSLSIDNTDRSPEHVADEIVAFVRPWLSSSPAR